MALEQVAEATGVAFAVDREPGHVADELKVDAIFNKCYQKEGITVYIIVYFNYYRYDIFS